jgi:hypothetical protein
MKRPSISDSRRVRIFQESDYCCVYCGELASVLDHVIPYAYGGSSSDDNLVAACVRCNAIASDHVFSSFTEKYLWLRAGQVGISLSVPALPPKTEPMEPFVRLKKRAPSTLAHRKIGPDASEVRRMRRLRDEEDMRALLIEIRSNTS